MIKKIIKVLEKIALSPIFVIIFTLLAGYFLLQNNRKLKRVELSRNNIHLTEKEVSSLQESIENLDLELNQANNSLAKEKIIRDELLQQKENELVLKLPDLVESDTKIEETEEKSNFEKWFELLQ